GAAVLGVIGVGGDVVQHRLGAGFAEAVGGDIAGIGIAGAVLEDLGGVEQLVAVLIAGHRQLLVDLVDEGLAGGGVVRGFGHRGQRADDEVTVGVGGVQRFEHVAEVHQETVGGGPVGEIVAAQQDDHPAGLHLGQGLGDGVG